MDVIFLEEWGIDISWIDVELMLNWFVDSYWRMVVTIGFS